MMGDILDYDKLCRITQATERMAQRAGQSVPLAAYNKVVALHNDLVRRYEALSEKHHIADTGLDEMIRNRDEWSEFAEKMRRRAEKAEAQVASLKAELKAKGNRS
ncbi:MULTISPECIES: hypothetical protein [Gluconobacter]|uniref:hypothetical protein n=1 Tax=Gluconobacter TaxID=441 RepID=UPI00201199DD|nr:MULTISPECIES: hypothetical protein [Gluconobacter]